MVPASAPFRGGCALSQVAVPQRSPQGCSATMETPWRDACAIPPLTPCLQEPPKLLWDCSQKSELWSGSRKPAGESCRDPVVLADISFQSVKFPKYADIFQVISITSISACPGTSAMHHLWGPILGVCRTGTNLPH